MTSMISFFRSSSQFKHLSKKMFSNKFKIDHFAYRTFDMNNIINCYPDCTVEKDIYNFPNNVTAKWLSNKNDPYIFVSQYNGLIHDKKIKSETTINLDKLSNVIKGYDKPSYDMYKKLNEHNQYLAWTILFKNEINHVAFLVDDIEETLNTIKEKYPEYSLTNPNAPIQVSEDKELFQFAIKAETIDYKFSDVVKSVPFSFIEFVERKNGRRGFEGNNASKIFESTK